MARANTKVQLLERSEYVEHLLLTWEAGIGAVRARPHGRYSARTVTNPLTQVEERVKPCPAAQRPTKFLCRSYQLLHLHNNIVFNLMYYKISKWRAWA
jgi:hypothetical protein